MRDRSEMREDAAKAAKQALGTARKAAYAVVGAPVVAGRKLKETTGKLTGSARKEFDAWVAEGEQMTARLRERDVVEEIKERVDFDELQDRVERLRDQLEEVLTTWRETFMAQDAPSAAEDAEKKEAPAAAPKKGTAGKAATKTAAAAKASGKAATKKPASGS